ncbi:MAG: Ig-like domain repeat protein, partial [Acidobacteriaceae bacterium]
MILTFFGVSLLASVPAAHAQNLTTFPATAVGTTTPATETVTVQVTGSVASVEVLAMGAPNLDFTETGDTCVGEGSGSCTVTVAFAPKYPGARNGAVVLLGADHVTVGTAYLTGIGQGSLGVLVPGSIGIAAGQVTEWTQVNDGSPATQADLYLPSGVAVDGLGDLFIADSHHNRVREVYGSGPNAGTIQTIAGNGSAGYEATNSVANNTPLSVPGGVAVDGAGNVYIADTNNNVIREVNVATNTMATVAGNASPGYSGDGSAATSAELNSPEGVVVDAAGNLYIADTGNNAIREVNAATGVITTIAGTGTAGFSGDGALATAAKLSAPYGVALDATGDLFIADSGNNRVRKVDASGTITTLAGSANSGYLGDGGAGPQAELYSPLGVACDPAGNVYIADARNYVIRKVSAATGVITTVAGDNGVSVYGDGKGTFSYGNGQNGDNYSGGGIATGAGIYAPYGIAVDQAGNLLIAEYFDHIIRKVTANAATLFVSPELWVNQVSGPQSQIVENDGNQPLTFSMVASDANASTDTGSTSCSATASVAVDAQCTVGAEFAPTSTANPLPNPLVGNVQLAGNPADSPLDIAVVGQALGQNGAQVALSSSQNPSAYGQTVNLNVAVQQDPNSTQGTPTGTVTYTDVFKGTTTTLGTQTLDGKGDASLPVSTLAVGTHVITANYSGDTYYSAASSNTIAQVVAEQVTVGLASSSANNTSTLGTSVTFTATVTVSGGVGVSGAVSFYNGATYMGSGTLNGSGAATYTTANLPVGSNPITATYTDSNNVSATSSVLNQIVEQQTSTTLSASANPG